MGWSAGGKREGRLVSQEHAGNGKIGDRTGPKIIYFSSIPAPLK